jgi:uncharacterized protein (DUF433 family)
MVSSEEVPVPKDIRFDIPLFTIEEAAHHLGLPRTTLQAWTRRQAGPAPLVHRIVDPDSPRAASLPFVAVVEAHMLRGFRDLGLSAQGLRVSVTRLRHDLNDEYALATRRVATDGVSLLADMSRSGDHAEWTRVVDGQLAIREVIEGYLKFVRWGKDDYPTRLRLKAYQGADVIIDPRFAFGQPVLERQKVRVEDILDAFWAGESPHTIATEFGVKADEVEAVIRSATRPRAA